MRVVIIGLGGQGEKRLVELGGAAVALIDPYQPNATHKSLEEVDFSSFDSAFLCIPEHVKFEYIKTLLIHGKNVLVEKPLLLKNEDEYEQLSEITKVKEVVGYTAYNHRFEPSVRMLSDLLKKNELGEIYNVRMLYGNGTARDVRSSPWRDQGLGVITDLGCHLLDLVLFLFGWVPDPTAWNLAMADRFENKAPDHAILFANSHSGSPSFLLEMSLVCWENNFAIDVFGELGSAHVSSLSKWGESVFEKKTRVFPSGAPNVEATRTAKGDTTWRAERAHFEEMVSRKEKHSFARDLIIYRIFNELKNKI